MNRKLDEADDVAAVLLFGVVVILTLALVWITV